MEPLQLIVDALALGAVYALVALGFVLVLNGLGAVNLAHGDLVTFGGFLAVAAASWLPAWPGVAFLPLIALAMAVIGALLAGLLPIRRRGAAPEDVSLASFAVGAILAAILTVNFGTAPVAGPALLAAGDIRLLGTGVSRQSLLILGTAIVLVPAVHLFLNGTQFGRRLRAAGQDPDLAQALGIETGRMAAATLALGTILAGVAGMLLADKFTISPMFGLDLLAKSYIAVAIAGWGQVGGAATIAFLIAPLETAVSTVTVPAVADGIVYIALLMFLAFQPQGLFGPAAQRRA